MPLNVNDSDLHPNMTELPESRKGLTEMSVSLVAFEFANIFRRILYAPPGAAWPGPSFAALTVDQKEKWIAQSHERMEDTYLADVDLSVPSFWVAATLTRLLLSKMWLMAFHPLHRINDSVKLPERIKKKLFLAAIESMEYANLLDNDPRAQKWTWLFRTYFQWHSAVFALSELCKDTEGDLVERAWSAIEVLIRTRTSDLQAGFRQALLWRPLKRLLLKARMAREKTLLAERRGSLEPIACYPAIDTLLNSRGTKGATLGQFASSTTETRVIADNPGGQFAANWIPGIISVDQEVDRLANTGLGWPAASMNTTFLNPGPVDLQPQTQDDDPEGHLLGNWETWNDMATAYEAENNVGSIPETWAWY